MTSMPSALTLSLVLLALPTWGAAPMVTRSAAGADAAAISDAVNQFRADLGGANNGVNAHNGSDGRREINWDAVPNAFSAPNLHPTNFFNRNSQRGPLAFFDSNDQLLGRVWAPTASSGLSFVGASMADGLLHRRQASNRAAAP